MTQNYRKFILFLIPILFVGIIFAAGQITKDDNKFQDLQATANLDSSKKKVFEEIESESQIILIGTVTDVSATHEKTGIYTYSTIQVEDLIKGNTGSEIIIRYAGGTVNGIAMTDSASESVSWDVNQRNLFFLRRSTLAPYYVLSKHGKFSINTLPSGKDILLPSLEASAELNVNYEINSMFQNQFLLKEQVLQFLR